MKEFLQETHNNVTGENVPTNSFNNKTKAINKNVNGAKESPSLSPPSTNTFLPKNAFREIFHMMKEDRMRMEEQQTTERNLAAEFAQHKILVTKEHVPERVRIH